MTKRFMVAAVFLAGCAVGGVSGQLVVPRASAQQAATLTKWEMFCKTIEPDDGDERAAAIVAAGNKAGQEGWEPVGDSWGGKLGDSVPWCFKRPKM